MATARRPATVDVLIPVYNGGRTVARAVQSISAQTLDDVRIIVVDDGSTDDSPTILANLAREDSRIEVVTTLNGGIVDALNVAVARSTADFVARHDADDLAFPERLEMQLMFMRANPRHVAVGCNAFHIDAEDRRTGYVTQFDEDVASDPSYAPSTEPYLLHPFLFAKRAALIEAGGYRHAFHSEDTDLYWRLARLGPMANLPAVLGEYRNHPDSVSARSILNGRIAAVDSQKAAVSERRRRAGLPDIVFDKSTLKAYIAAESLAGILAIASDGMSDDERGYLQIASAAKLLELSSYRPYRLTPADLDTIRTAIEANLHRVSDFNARQLVFRVILGRRRRPGGLQEVLRLLPWRAMPTSLRNLATFVVRKRLGRHG